MRWLKQVFLLFCFMAFPCEISSAHVCIVVHGTWAPQEPWYQPGGDFFQEIACAGEDIFDEVISFTWSGNNNTKDRREAGKELAQLIEQYDLATIVAHSHGATVAILASHYLARNSQVYQSKNRYKIQSLYALGVPVDEYDGLPEMNIVCFFYNIFSFNDSVQPVFGLFDRTFTDHERIANISITIDGVEPNHSELHHPIVGSHLFGIHEKFYNYCIGGFERFVFFRPGIVHFYKDGPPKYELDENRECLLDSDKYMNQLLLYALTRSQENYRQYQ